MTQLLHGSFEGLGSTGGVILPRVGLFSLGLFYDELWVG